MNRFENKQTGVLSCFDLKQLRWKIGYGIIIFILTVTAVVSLLPAIWTILTSFKDTQEIYSSFSFFPRNLSWNKVVTRVSETWSYLQLGKPIVNTIIMSLGNLVVSIVVCGFGGYVLSKMKPKGTKLIFTLVVWTMMMPGQIRLVPNYMTYIHFPFAFDSGVGVNLLDTFWPMWLGAGADTFSVLLFKNAFDGLSNSYVEAAKVDGCSNYGIFFKIMMPLVTPIICFQAIGILSGAWSDFFTPMLVLDKNVVVPLAIFRLKSDFNIQMNTYFMALVIASIPPFLIFVIFQKQIIGGVNIGGVKG